VWCGLRTYTSSLQVDPVHDVGLGDSRVVRGGNWYLYVARYCRSAYRDLYSPVSTGTSYGFRPVRSAFAPD
jgi:formylglycine-generating enzyme required for sulfatase activity